MNRLALVALTAVAVGCTSGKKMSNESSIIQPKPPIAIKVPHEFKAHGHTRVDNYHWMRDDQRNDPKVIAHLNAENAYKDKMLAPLQQARASLVDELISRIEKDDSSVPMLDNGYWYYRRFAGDAEYPVYVRKAGSLDAEEEILLDGNIMAKGHDYFSIGDSAVSTNNQYLAYSVDTISRRIYTIYVKNLANGQQLSDELKDTSGQVIWANDNKSLYYIKKDLQTLLGYQVYRHTLGQPQSQDKLIYEEKDNTFYTYLTQSKDKQAILINHSQTIKQGASVLDANDPNAMPVLVYPLEDGHEYNVNKLGDYYYIRTNWKAKNFRLVRVHKNNLSDRSKWQDVVPARAEVFLRSFELFDNHLVVQEKEQGLARVVVSNLDGTKPRIIPFDDEVFVTYLTGNAQPDNRNLRLYYSSLTTPATIYDIDLNSFNKQIKKQDKVLGSFDSANYQAQRIYIAARDGKKVPVSLVYRKDKFKQDGTNPLYQYAYGSYGSTSEPSFRYNWLSLLDRGFVVATAHIRGGQMLGRDWYEDGKMQNKINTFTDFIDVTKGLVAQKYANKNKVFAMGGSAGGLLMGAVANMAPQLYKGMVAHVPFVDVVTTMSDASLPLTANEWDEWGNPIKSKSDYEYMLSYSPYDQVEAKDYPNLLVTTGLHDSQVQYFEPMKWVAKLRELKTDDNQILFHIDMEAGHGGASGRFKSLEDTALEYVWIIHLAGMQK